MEGVLPVSVILRRNEVKKVNVAAFEAAVFQTEHIEIRIRASITEEVDDYDFSRKAHDGTIVTK